MIINLYFSKKHFLYLKVKRDSSDIELYCKSFDQFIIPINNLDSLILKNKDELNKFNNLFSNKINIKNIKLLYRTSRDGFNLNILKDKINNKSNLIFLFLTGNTRIFGTFISSKIEVEDKKYIKDENAFVFSLNNNKIYKILIPEYSISFRIDNLLIGNNWNSNGFNLYSGKFYENLLKNPKIYDFQKDKELTEGKNEFNELEIFEINYD